MQEQEQVVQEQEQISSTTPEKDSLPFLYSSCPWSSSPIGGHNEQPDMGKLVQQKASIFYNTFAPISRGIFLILPEPNPLV